MSVATIGQSVLERVARGEADAERSLVDRYGGLVWSIARRYCTDRAEAEDAVQEILLDVWRSARDQRFDASRGSDTTFVAMIARRRLIDRLRRRRADVPLSEIAEAEGAAQMPGPAVVREGLGEEARAAARALNGLSPPQQTAIRLAILHGLTHEQVAEVTGMPLGTVKTHIRRGLLRLREALLGQGSGGSADERAPKGVER